MRLLPVVLVVVAATAAAQFPPATEYVTGYAVSGSKGLVGLDSRGTVTTLVPLSAPFFSVEMGPTNDELLAWGAKGLHIYNVNSGLTTFTTLAGSTPPGPFGGLFGGLVDEDGGMVWLTAVHGYQPPPMLYRSASTRGTGATVVTSITVLSPVQLSIPPCWDGTTGDYVTAARILVTFSTIEFHDRRGVRTRTVGNVPYPMDVDWSPWTGDLIVATQINTLMRLSPGGSLTTISTLAVPDRGGGWSVPMSIRVLHQSPNGREMFLIGEREQTPPISPELWLVTATGGVTVLHTGPLTVFGVERVRSRNLWATGPWRRGAAGPLHVDMTMRHAGENYQVALSTAHSPGIQLGRHRVHLAPDLLFRVSARGNWPGLFESFAGVLDASGKPTGTQPQVRIPNLPGLAGLRVFGGAVTFNRQGVTGASNCWGITIQ